jgi:hypothetical protein
MSRKQAASLFTTQDLDDDIIWGVEGEHGIAALLKRTPAQVYYLIRKGLPVRRFGHRTICGSRRKLLAYCSGEFPTA